MLDPGILSQKRGIKETLRYNCIITRILVTSTPSYLVAKYRDIIHQFGDIFRGLEKKNMKKLQVLV